MNDQEHNEKQPAGYLVVTKGYPVVIQLEDAQIHGQVHLQRGQRVKDALNTIEPFIAVTKATFYDVDGKTAMREADFIAVNRNMVIWAVEADGQSPVDEKS